MCENLEMENITKGATSGSRYKITGFIHKNPIFVFQVGWTWNTSPTNQLVSPKTTVSNSFLRQWFGNHVLMLEG